MTNAIPPTRVYSREEATEILQVSLSTVKRMIASGQLKVSQPFDMRRVFITGQALLETGQATEDSLCQHRDPIQPNKIYSRQEAADALNVSLSTIKRLIATHQIRVSQPDGMRRMFISGQALLDFLKAIEAKPDLD